MGSVGSDQEVEEGLTKTLCPILEKWPHTFDLGAVGSLPCGLIAISGRVQLQKGVVSKGGELRCLGGLGQPLLERWRHSDCRKAMVQNGQESSGIAELSGYCEGSI
jgi:hypothetical protein